MLGDWGTCVLIAAAFPLSFNKVSFKRLLFVVFISDWDSAGICRAFFGWGNESGELKFQIVLSGVFFLSQLKYKYTAMNQSRSWAVACVDPLLNGFYSGWGKTLMTHKVFCAVICNTEIMSHWVKKDIFLYNCSFHCSFEKNSGANPITRLRESN